MIRWVLAIIGLAYGWEVFDLTVGILVAVVGFVIGRWLEQRSSDTTPPVRRPANTVAQELLQLKQRVAQLENEVAQLKVGANLSTESTPAEVPEASSAQPSFATPTTPPPPTAPITPVAESTAATLSTASPSQTDAELLVPQSPAATPRPARPASAPSPIDQAISAAQNWLFGGNTVVRLGMLILFFGVSFLLKFAADNQLLPIEARLAGLSLGAAAIFIVGWRLRQTRRSYALIMQGGALGVLYFTVYGAMKLYQLIPSSSAFALLALLGVAAAVLSIRQDASALAVTGIFGGFLAPILTSDGSGNHVMLFSYFAVLNAGIFAIAWFKAWRALNLLGFIFTYLIATLWGIFDYRSELRASTLPFVVIFWLFFAAISTLYAIKRSHTLRSMVDGTLVFGTPIITMGLLSRLMSDTEYGLCFSALIGATFYLGLAAWLHSRRDDSLRLFTEAQLAIGVLLATLAIPLAFDGNVTAAMWAVEGAGVVWVSLRQQRRLALLFGLILQFAAGLAVVMSSPYYTETPLLNGVYLANLLLALSGLFCAWQLHEKQSGGPLKAGLSQFGWLLGGWGLLWWGKAHWDEINTFLSGDARFNAALLLIALTAGLFQQLALRGWWRNARVVALALGPVLLLLAAEQYTQWPHLFSLWAWPVALIALFALLYQQDESEDGCEAWQHVIAAWLSWCIFINEMIYLSSQHIHSDVSRLAAFAALISAAVAAIKFLPWPIKAHWRAYWVYGTAPMAALLCGWGFYSALSGGASGLPLLNALDLAQLATLLVLGFWLKHTLIELNTSTPPRWLWATAGAAIFVWLNAMLLRTLHHQQQIAYTFDSLRNSNLVQMSLSIFWTLISLTLMFAATRKHWRTLWLVGASLQAIVIGKLFIVDLSHISGLERIASFMGVGLLLLLIGYLAPIPPEKTDHRQS